MSDNIPIDYKNKTFIRFGNKYFFCSGKYSINSKPIGLSIYLIIFSYNFGHTFYFIYKLVDTSIGYLIILIIYSILFCLQLYQSMETALIDPGSFLPNYKEDYSNSSDAKLMIATIKEQDYFLKFCYTCKIARDLRVHHCSDCNLCIIRHDHHCPWLSTCIGLNNHHQFFYLMIINIFFFAFNLSLLFCLLFLTNISQNNSTNKVFIYILIVLNGCIFLFHIALVTNHIIYISTGQTTSEKIKRAPGATNPHRLASKCDNIQEFWKYPMKYKERINYNDTANKYLDLNVLINDYLSGNYKVLPNKKIISKTLVEKGYKYTKGSIEMVNRANESEDESTESDKLGEDTNKNDNEIKLSE